MMPNVWRPPAVVVEVDGRKVYHVYHNGYPMAYWFSTAEWDDEIENLQEPSFQFDIRNLPVPLDWPVEKQIEYAIVNGLVEFPCK